MQTVAQLRVVTRRLERWDECFVDLLVKHTLRDAGDAAGYRRKLFRLMGKDKYISPQQAVELNLIDGIQEVGSL
jgi:hypothetical protein